jgi:hypothetical protein
MNSINHTFWDSDKSEVYYCQTCDKSFSKKTSLDAHQSVHNQKVGKCKYCGEEKFRLFLHEPKCTMNPIHYKECKQCGKQIIKEFLSQLTGVEHCSRLCEKRSRAFSYEYVKEQVSKMTYLNDLQNTSYPIIMRKNGWWDDLTSHLIRQVHKPYTEEEVREAALKYTRRIDFQKKSNGEYSAAFRLGIMEEVTAHMGKSLIEKQYTKDEIRKSAKKFNSQKEWLENEPQIFRCWQGYNKPNQSKKDIEFWKEINDQLGYIFKPNGYWTKERCKEIADKYTDRRIFNEEQKVVYNVIARDGWVDELLSHMIWTTTTGNIHYPSDHVWTLQDAKKEAKKYKFRGELRSVNNHLYRWIKTHKWEGKCYPHMKEFNLAKRHIYAEEFENSKTAYIGLSCQIERRHNAHLGKESRYGEITSPVYHHMKQTGEEPKLKILTRRPVNSENAGEVENSYIKKYKDNGWKLLNTAKAGSLGSMRPKWTYKKFQKIKKECKTQEEFHKKLESYQKSIAIENGWWKKLISDLPIESKTGRIPKTRWTLEEALKVAKKCKGTVELQKKYSAAYKTILRNGGREALREIYPNMILLYRDLDEEGVLNISKKFKLISDLRFAHSAVYQFIIDNNLLDKTFPNRRKEQVPYKYWNEKTVTEAAKKCQKVSDLPSGAYSFVIKNKLQKKLFPKTYFGKGWSHINKKKKHNVPTLL